MFFVFSLHTSVQYPHKWVRNTSSGTQPENRSHWIMVKSGQIPQHCTHKYICAHTHAHADETLSFDGQQVPVKKCV